MCGLTGFWQPQGCPRDEAAATVRRMADTLAHRGPDDAGMWVDAGAGLALGHRRLAILDLSPAGHQPMTSASGRYVIAFNGEIYNHLNLRPKLEGARYPVPTGPGLGVEFNEDAFKQQTFKFWEAPKLFRRDGSVQNW